METLTDAELVKKVRGQKTQINFAKELGVAQSMNSDWERGAHSPSGAIWVRMADLASYPYNVYCWMRAGFSRENIEVLLTALRLKDEPHSLEREQVKRDLYELGIHPEPVTEPLGDEPVRGEPESLKGLSKDIAEWCARNRMLPPVEPVIEEPKSAAPAKKVKRDRRRKK